MHVCIVSAFPPSTGPLSEYTYYLVKYLSTESSISRITILADVTKNNIDALLPDKVIVKRCWKMNSISVFFDILSNVARVNCDIVYFNLVFRNFSSNRVKNFLGLLTVYFSKLIGKKIVLTLHYVPDPGEVENVGYRNSYMNKFGYKVIMRSLLKADIITMPHQHFIEVTKKEYNSDKVVLVPHGVFNAPVKDFVPGGNNFLIFGKIGPYKGLEIALDALRLLNKRRKKVGLVIAGAPHPMHPEYVEEVLKGYEELPNIEFKGYVKEEDLGDLFQSSVAILLPYSLTVWSSSVFVISCTYGKPVIASDLADFKELKKEGAGILTFKVNNIAELASQMELILDDENLQKRLGESNIKWAKRNNFQEVALKLLDRFNEVLYDR